MRRFVFQVLVVTLILYLVAKFLPGIEYHGSIGLLLLAGFTLGILNYFIKPVLSFITFPLKILTFGLIGLVINIGLVWFTLEIIFQPYFKISGLSNLFYLSLMLWPFSYSFRFKTIFRKK